MAGHPRPTDVPIDGDGVRIVADPGVASAVLRSLAGAAALVTIAAVAPIAARAAATPSADRESSPEKDVAMSQSNPSSGKTGITLFPPRGTKPLKRGIVVPDDFDLPPGYVRHYQTTDDGKRLPPVLMFHPDYHPVDERGRPIPVPADRIVPREFAPPGMPIRMLDLPKQPTPDE